MPLLEILKKHWPAPTLLLSWLVIMLVVWPVGEFAINDDWGFSTSIFWWKESGELEFTHWFAMTLVTQLALGAVWAELFGYSQTALRILIALISGGALVAIYALARECGNTRRMAFAIAALLAAYAPYIMNAHSFMTDAPFVFFTVTSMFFFARVLGRTQRWGRSYTLGIIFLVLATLVRQPAFVVGIAFVLGDLVARNGDWRSLLRTVPVAILGVGVVALFPIVINSFSELQPEYFKRTEHMKSIIADLASFNIGALAPAITASIKGALYLGLLASPIALAVGVWRAQSQRITPLQIGAFAVVSLGLLGAAVMTGLYIPEIGNTLTREGVGPRLVEPYRAEAPLTIFWAIANAAAILSFSVLTVEALSGLLAAVDRARKLEGNPRMNGVWIMVLASAAAAFAPYGLHYGPWFDRYVFFSGMAVIMAVAGLCNWSALARGPGIAAAAVIGVLCMLSVVMARDYFTWARIRTDLTMEAVHNFDLDPEMIDGGFEYNNHTALMESTTETRPDRAVPEANVKARPYRVAKRPLEGYEVIQIAETRQILPFGGDAIYLLRKEE